MAETEEVETTPISDVITGQVSGGYLRLTGQLWKIHIQPFPETFVRSLGLNWSVDISTAEDVETNIFCQDQISPTYSGTPHLQIYPRIEHLRQAQEIFIRPLIYPVHDKEKDSIETSWLILCPKDGVAGCYRKISTC
jgi:hypothetical protein